MLHNDAICLPLLALDVVPVALGGRKVFVALKSPVVFLRKPSVLVSIRNRNIAILVEAPRVHGTISSVAMIYDWRPKSQFSNSIKVTVRSVN